MTSSRLPGKVLLPLVGDTVLSRVVRRAAAIPGVDRVCVAAPEGAAHDPIEAEATRLGVACSRGPEHDVLRRTRIAADRAGAARVVRITSDCPLVDPNVAGRVVEAQRKRSAGFAATALDRGYPIGLDVEVFPIEALREADDLARDAYEREHVTPYLWRRPERFEPWYLDRKPDRRAWRLALDTPEDLEVIRRITERLLPEGPGFGFDAIEPLLLAEPEILDPSRNVVQTPYELSESRVST